MDLRASSLSSLSVVRLRAGPVGERGFTLVEAMVVVAIVGILVATAVPGYARFVSTQRATTVVNDLVHAIALARSEALKRGQRVYLAPFDGHWHNGWAVFVDRNDNLLYDRTDPSIDELIARHDAIGASTVIANPSNPAREAFTDVGAPQRAYVMFDGSGYPRQRGGGFLAGSFVITDRTGSSITVRTICLASYGRVRVVVDRAGCS